jgi:3-oxo-5-alpha-steroid 4-dehydrogenase 1
MEIPGFLTLLYVMNTLPAQLGIAQLPWENKVLGALFVHSLSPL